MLQFWRVAFAFATLAAFAAFTPALHAAPAPPDAGKAVTFPYPANAPIVVQVNGLQATRARVNTLLKSALPDDAAEIDKQIGDGLDMLFAGRKLNAIPKDGRIFFVVHDVAALFNNQFPISVLVPVTSYKEFRDTFLTADEKKTVDAGKNGIDEVRLTFFGNEQTVYMTDLKEYIAISPDKATTESYTQKYTKAVSTDLTPELAKTVVASDLSVYVNFAEINKLYGEQIRQFKGFIDLAFMQGGAIPGMSKKQIESMKVVMKSLFQAVEDSQAIVLGLEFRAEGVNLRLQAQFADGTETVKLVKSEFPAPLDNVSKLPAGLRQYSGSKFSPKFGETISGLASPFAPADDDDKGQEAIEKLQKELHAAELLGEISASGTPDVSLTLSTYADGKKALKSLVGSYEAMVSGGRVQNVVLKDKPKVTAGAKKYKDFTFTEVKLVFDFDASVKDLPDTAKEAMLAQLKQLVTEKMTLWVGTDGTSVVQVSAKDWDAANAALDQYFSAKKAIGETAGYKLTRKNLPQDANYLALMETGQTLTGLLEGAKALGEAAGPDFPPIGKVKPPKGDPTYIGIALALKGDTAAFNLFVPGTAITAGHGMLKDVFKKVE